MSPIRLQVKRKCNYFENKKWVFLLSKLKSANVPFPLAEGSFMLHSALRALIADLNERDGQAGECRQRIFRRLDECAARAKESFHCAFVLQSYLS